MSRATDFGSEHALSLPLGVYSLGSTLWGSTISGYRFWIYFCTHQARISGGLLSGGLLSGGLLSRATDFGSGSVFMSRISGGLLSGGLVSRATDFGSENALIRLESLGVYSLGVYSLGV